MATWRQRFALVAVIAMLAPAAAVRQLEETAVRPPEEAAPPREETMEMALEKLEQEIELGKARAEKLGDSSHVRVRAHQRGSLSAASRARQNKQEADALDRLVDHVALQMQAILRAHEDGENERDISADMAAIRQQLQEQKAARAAAEARVEELEAQRGEEGGALQAAPASKAVEVLQEKIEALRHARAAAERRVKELEGKVGDLQTAAGRLPAECRAARAAPPRQAGAAGNSTADAAAELAQHNCTSELVQTPCFRWRSGQLEEELSANARMLNITQRLRERVTEYERQEAGRKEADDRAAVLATDISLEDFFVPAHEWSTRGQDEEHRQRATGGTSSGSLLTRCGRPAVFRGSVRPTALNTSGFVQAATSEPYPQFPDIRSCAGVKVTVRTPAAVLPPYDQRPASFYVSFGTARPINATTNGFRQGYTAGYKAKFTPPRYSMREPDKWTDIVIPFEHFSNSWDDTTGAAITECDVKSSSAAFCPDQETLQEVRTVSLWAAAEARDFELHLRSINATGCNPARPLHPKVASFPAVAPSKARRQYRQHTEVAMVMSDSRDVADGGYLALAYDINARYAVRHGYPLHYARWPCLSDHSTDGKADTKSCIGCVHPRHGPRAPAWCKLLAINETMAKFPQAKYVVYLDSDAFVQSQNATLDEMLRLNVDNRPLTLFWNYPWQQETPANSGIHFWQNTAEARDLLQFWWDTPGFDPGKFNMLHDFEQSVLHRMPGFWDLKGDLITILERTTMGKQGEPIDPDQFFVHLPHVRGDDRIPVMSAFRKRLMAEEQGRDFSLGRDWFKK